MYVIDGRYITVTLNIHTTKSNVDWFCCFSESYRPRYDFVFDYFLGEQKYVGKVTAGGYMYFYDLNTTDLLSCCFSFPIA